MAVSPPCTPKVDRVYCAVPMGFGEACTPGAVALAWPEGATAAGLSILVCAGPGLSEMPVAAGLGSSVGVGDGRGAAIVALKIV